MSPFYVYLKGTISVKHGWPAFQIVSVSMYYIAIGLFLEKLAKLSE